MRMKKKTHKTGYGRSYIFIQEESFLPMNMNTSEKKVADTSLSEGVVLRARRVGAAEG